VPTAAELEHVKRVKLDQHEITFLNLIELRYPHTWTVTLKSKTYKPIVEGKYLQMVSCDYIDVGFDDLGQREYVARSDFSSTMESKQPLPLHTEEAVKDVRRANPKTVVWFATYHYTNEGYQDYHIVEELCWGQNKLVISNESVLTAPLSGRPSVLDNISLIVNCNMASPPPYTVKSQRVICHPVHAMSRARGASDFKLAAINEDIWAGLQTGNVVVHCLAGVHRASCIVVSHALFRHYKLKHTHISSDIATIYTKLASIRKGVQPLGYLALVTSFREYLEKEAILERAQQALRAEATKEVEQAPIVETTTESEPELSKEAEAQVESEKET
jgi:hypothetical protein